jgi:hypothetical protein
MRKTEVQSQPRQIVLRDPISKKHPSQKRAGGVAQVVGPEFKPLLPNPQRRKKERNSDICLQYGLP